MWEPLDRGTRHQEGLQDSSFHHGHGACGHALVIEAIPAVEVYAAFLPPGRVEDDGEKIRQNRGVHALGESLSLRFVLLPVALDAVSEDLVKEHAGGAP